jgi:glycosyltransferase involved in cell wall biosynthesis
VHVYLTVPFVLSWSLLEAIACGCLVVGADTPPVREAIEDGKNGLLVDFRDPAALARRIETALALGQAGHRLRSAARQTMLDRYALCDLLPRQLELLGVGSLGARSCDSGRGVLGRSRLTSGNGLAQGA